MLARLTEEAARVFIRGRHALATETAAWKEGSSGVSYNGATELGL